MAKATNVTKYDAGGSGDNIIDKGLVKSPVYVWTDTYEASALATADTVDIAVLPIGAKVVDVAVFHDDLCGAAGTITVGDSSDADRYIVISSVASASVARMNAVDGSMYVIGTASGDEVIKLTALTSTMTGTIKSVVSYTL